MRKGLGLAFEGAAFEEQYMLGDVEVDWAMPRAHRAAVSTAINTGVHPCELFEHAPESAVQSPPMPR